MTHQAPNPAAGAGSASPGHDPERDRLAEVLLEHCWEIVGESLLSRTSDVFNDAVSAAVRSGEETPVRCARTVALQIKSLAHAYRGLLRAKFDQTSASFLRKRSAHGALQSGLSLMEMDESDLANELGHLTARLRNSVQVPFAGLLQRLQALAGGERELQEADTPLRPGIFLEALSESLAPVLTGHELVALLRYFPAAIGPPLTATYEAINRFLDSKGIVPAAVVHRTPVKRVAPPPTIRADLPASMEALSAGVDPMPAPVEAGSLGRSVGKAPGSARAGTSRVLSPSTAGRREAAARPEEQLIVEYGRLQALVGVNASSLVDAAINAAAGREFTAAPASSKLHHVMLAAQRQDAELLAAKLRKHEPGKDPAAKEADKEPVGTREHSVRLVALAPQPVQKLTIQLVARLFTRIERDRLVPAPIRALLLFVRFPVLEVALADPALFVRPEHPARRLIDAIGSSSIGWTPEGASNRRYLQHVRAAVQYILHSPGEAASAFGQSSEQFSAILRADPTQADDPLAKAKQALQEAEERELRAGEVSVFLRDLLEGAQLEPYLRAFLLQVWARVIVEAAAREDQHPGLLRRLLSAVPDLVWSVQPLANPADRKRLVDTIPAVLGSLRDGLRLIRWPEAKLHELLNHLMGAHSHALKGNDSSAIGTSFSVSTVRIRLDGFRIHEASGAPHEGPIDIVEEAVQQVLETSASGVSHLWVQGDNVPAFGPMDAMQAEALMAAWQENLWFDLHIGRSVTRVRLEWFTPARSLALFSSSAGDARYSLSRETLITFLRCSWIAPAEPMPLVERAFHTVLSDLDRASKAAADGGTADA